MFFRETISLFFFIPLSQKWVPNIQINSGNDLTVKMKQTYKFLGYWRSVQSPGFNELLYALHVNKI